MILKQHLDDVFQSLQSHKFKLRTFLSDPYGAIGFCIILIMTLSAILAPLVATHDPYEINETRILEGPSSDFWFGTDNLGRDTFSRIVFGIRIALSIGVMSTIVSVTLGIALGVIAGYFSSLWDFILISLFDIIRAIPPLLLAIAIIVLASASSIPTLIFVLGLCTFPRYARLIRTQTLSIKEQEYVIAARITGAPSLRIIVKHILPNIVGPLFITAAMGIPAAISFEAGLSFLGLGVQPPAASWGSILRTGFIHIRSSPWMVIFAGLALVFATLGFTLSAEALRDAYDPKSQGSPR